MTKGKQEKVIEIQIANENEKKSPLKVIGNLHMKMKNMRKQKKQKKVRRAKEEIPIQKRKNRQKARKNATKRVESRAK